MENKAIYILPLMIVLALSIISAATITVVVGKVYTTDYSSTVSGVNVEVTCNSNTLSTTSKSDGTFAVGFETSKCREGDTVSATSAGYATDDVTIEIEAESQPTSSSSSSSSGSTRASVSSFYACGNGICDSGETNVTCQRDCKIQATTPNETVVSQIKEVQEITTPITEENEEVGTSLVTGAATGALGSASIIVVIVFISLILIASVYVYVKRKNSLISRKYGYYNTKKLY